MNDGSKRFSPVEIYRVANGFMVKSASHDQSDYNTYVFMNMNALCEWLIDKDKGQPE